jgi:hypothetical protein
MSLTDKILEVPKEFAERNWSKIIAHSPTLRFLTARYRLAKRKLNQFSIQNFLALAVGMFLITASVVLMFPYLFFSDRCYLMSVEHLELSNTTSSRPCVHGSLLAFTAVTEDGSPNLFFSSKLITEDPIQDRWYQNEAKSRDARPDAINYRYTIKDREYLVDADKGQCKIESPGAPGQTHIIGTRLITTEARPRKKASPDWLKCTTLPSDNPKYHNCDWVNYEILVPTFMPSRLCKPRNWLDFWTANKKSGVTAQPFLCIRRVEIDPQSKEWKPATEWAPYWKIQSVWCD